MRRVSMILAFAVFLCALPARSFDDGFRNMEGVLTYTSSDFNKVAGGKVIFTGLDGTRPVMIWRDGIESILTKIHSSPELLVLQSVGVTGSTDTVYIEPKAKRFLVVSVGVMAVPVGSGVKLTQYSGVMR